MTAPGGRQFEPSAAATVTGLLAAAEFGRGDLVAGRFRIDRLLGMGGMGLVYLARDEQLGVDVALKLLRPELAARPDAFERFRQELLLARQVSSPHVVRIHDLVQHGGIWLLSMDYVPGRSLQQMLDERLTLPAEQAIDIVRQIALGLAAAHQRGVIHRDLKPANILVTDTGEALITDFGVARSAGATGLTLSGTIVGTPEYLSPEQARAEPTDGRSDLYALGLILYEMLTGAVPFSGGTPAEMLAQRIVRSPPPVDSVKPGLPALAVGLCTGLLEVRPVRRFADAASVVRAIESGRVARPRVARFGRVALIAVTGLIAVAAAGWYFLRSVPAEPTVATATPTLDYAVLVAGPVAPDALAQRARGLEAELAARLIAAGLAAAEPARVQRALDELGVARERAPALRARLAATLGARHLLVITQDAAASPQLVVALHEGGNEAPQWREPVAGDGVDSKVWDALARRLDADLDRDPIAASELEALARVAPGVELSDPVATPAVDAPASLWWTTLQALQRSGRDADAAGIAREAIRHFAATTDAGHLRTLALAQFLTGDAESALTALDRSPAPSHDAPVLLLRARVLTALGRYDDAVSVLRDVVARDERHVEAWFELGKARLMQGEAQSAMDEALTRAAVAANRLSDRRMQAEIANAMGIGYRQLGQLEPAAEQFDRAVRLRDALGDESGVGVSLRNLAAVRTIQGRFDDAATLLAQARARLEPLGDPAALADLQNDVGLLAEERGDFRAALEAYRAALAYLQVGGDPALVAESQLNVGFSYYQLGEFDNAQVFLQQAASGYAAIDDQGGAIRALQGEGLLLVARGAFDAGRAKLQDSHDRAEALQMHEEQSAALAGLGELDRLEGRYADALVAARRAATMFEQRGDVRGRTEMALLGTAILLDLGAGEAARVALDAVTIDDLANLEQQAKFHLRLAEIAFVAARTAEAERESARALELATRSGVVQIEVGSRLLRARVLATLGRRRESLALLDAADAALGRFPSVPLRLAALETRLALAPQPALRDEARALIARLPAYGAEWRVETWAQAASTDAASREQAAQRAQAAQARIRPHVPAEHAAGFDASVDALQRQLPEGR